VTTLTNLVQLDLGYNFLSGAPSPGSPAAEASGLLRSVQQQHDRQNPPRSGGYAFVDLPPSGGKQVYGGTIPAALSKLNKLQVLDLGGMG